MCPEATDGVRVSRNGFALGDQHDSKGLECLVVRMLAASDGVEWTDVGTSLGLHQRGLRSSVSPTTMPLPTSTLTGYLPAFSLPFTRDKF